MRPEPCVATALDSIVDEEGIDLVCITVWVALDGIDGLISGLRRVGLSARFLDLPDELFEDRLVGRYSAADQACARRMEDKLRRGEALDDHAPDAFLAAAAATHGLAVVTRDTSDFRNTGVETAEPRTAAPR